MSGGLRRRARRAAARLALTAFCLPAVAVGVAAASDGFREVRGAPAASGVTVRSQPSPFAPIMDRLANGDVVRVIACRSEMGEAWCRVETERGVEGWSSDRHLAPAPPAPEPIPPESVGLLGNGLPFDLAGALPCAGTRQAPLRPCAFGAIRLAAGAALWIARPQGGERYILIEGDGSIATNGPGATLTAPGDPLMVRVGDERYAIPRSLLEED